MSSTTQSKSTDKRVKSPVENSGSKNDCEVSSSSKVNDFKAVQNSTEGNKENTAIVTVPAKFSYSNDNLKPDSKSEAKMNSDLEANNNINNNNKLRARPAKRSTSPTRLSACDMCNDSKQVLSYFLPTLTGEKFQFCSEMCIAEFRKATKKGACKQCGNIAKHKDYCSNCMNMAVSKNGKSTKIRSQINFFQIDFCFQEMMTSAAQQMLMESQKGHQEAIIAHSQGHFNMKHYKYSTGMII